MLRLLFAAPPQVQEFRACESSSGPVRCALYFEALGQRQEDVFFHCDQVRRKLVAMRCP